MYPELFTIPIINRPMGSYPFFILIGLILALITARRRAKKVGANLDLIPTAFLIIAFFGLAGCRLFYVIHYWEEEFANQPSPLKAALNIGPGGAELYGGVILTLLVLVIYFKLHRVSIKLYFDILTPSVMLAQGFGRLACFMHGCCWGALCLTAGHQPALPWAMQFPYGSLPFIHQWKDGIVPLPQELLFTYEGKEQPIPAEFLKLTEGQYSRFMTRAEDIAAGTESTRLDKPDMKIWASRMTSINKAVTGNSQAHSLDYAKLAELRSTAENLKSLPVHPVQLYFSVNAFLLSLLLAIVFKRRSRDGIVLGAFLVLYPLTRIVQEAIRADNPRDVFGLTVSTAISIGMLLAGSLYLLWINRQPRLYHAD